MPALADGNGVLNGAYLPTKKEKRAVIFIDTNTTDSMGFDVETEWKPSGEMLPFLLGNSIR
jgi:hypothetical protein